MPASTRRRLVLTALPGIGLVQPGADLASEILAAVTRAGEALETGDVLVVAQKIVSKAEGRAIDLREVAPSPRAVELAAEVGKDPRLVELILRESTEVVAHKRGVLIVAHRLGFVMANAGIDRSNVEQDAGSERVLLLPLDPDASAERLRAAIAARTGVSVGVVVNDTTGRPWRNGVVGFAIGAAGVPALRDQRGRPDLFGRPLEVTVVAHADELAAAASILMGQADEAAPVVLVRGAPADGEHQPAAALVRERAQDLFR